MLPYKFLLMVVGATLPFWICSCVFQLFYFRKKGYRLGKKKFFWMFVVSFLLIVGVGFSFTILSPSSWIAALDLLSIIELNVFSYLAVFIVPLLVAALMSTALVCFVVSKITKFD